MWHIYYNYIVASSLQSTRIWYCEHEVIGSTPSSHKDHWWC